jgi:glycosyltransferase involved in cell wall biosynthesis
LAKKLTLANNIIFWGWVEAERKLQLLKQAHCLCATSVREGWGLTVLEANGVGTPVIAYNVPGLRDAVKNGLNGMLTPQNNPHELAQCLIEFFNNPTLMKSLSENALSNSYHFNWDNTAEDFLKIMEGKIF